MIYKPDKFADKETMPISNTNKIIDKSDTHPISTLQDEINIGIEGEDTAPLLERY